MFSFLRKKPKQSVDELLALLSSVGFAFRNEKSKQFGLSNLGDDRFGGTVSIEHLLAVMGEEQFDEAAEEPSSLSDEVWSSDDVWHFDYEAIEDHGAYKQIVQNCCRISGGDLSFDEITDYVDLEEEVAWVELRTRSKYSKLTLKVKNDWADPSIFLELNKLLKAANSTKQLFQHDLGQDVLMICRPENEVISINKATGLKFFQIKG